MNPFRSMRYVARRFRVETTVNVVGLTVAMAAFYLLMTQIDFHGNYNRHIPDSERVYRLENVSGILTSRMMAAILEKMPQVEGVTELLCSEIQSILKVGMVTEHHSFVPTGLTPFGAVNARCVDGELQWQCYDDHSVIIPQSLARHLYDGETKVAGKTLLMDDKPVTIQGVYADLPPNCSMKNVVYYADSKDLDNEEAWDYIVFLKLKPEVDAEVFRQEFAEQLIQLMWEEKWKAAIERGDVTPDMEASMKQQFKEMSAVLGWTLRPFAETWFSDKDRGDRGNLSVFFIMQLACVFIIGLAFVNFFNFMLAQCPMRIRSLHVRRMLGESVTRLRLSLVVESMAWAGLACGLALVVCTAIAVQPPELLQGMLEPVRRPCLVAGMMLLAVVLGVVAGAYPAWYATSFPPSVAQRGASGLVAKGRWLRFLLVGLQLAVSMFMLVIIGILLLQSRYISQSECGYRKDEILCARLPDEMQPLKAEIRRRLLLMEGVESVSYSRFMLGTLDSYVGWTIYDADKNVNLGFTCLYVDPNYLSAMGIKVIEGRDFVAQDSNCFIINEAARQLWPWVKMGEPLSKDDLPVVGVCENLRFASVRKNRNEPLAFVVLSESFNGWGDQLGVLNVRIGKQFDKRMVRQRVEQLLYEMAGEHEVEVVSLDEQVEKLYQDEDSFLQLMSFLSAASILITLMGVFCLTVFEVEYRRKEIGIRKVFGASAREIMLQFCRRYVWLLLGSFAVETPLAWYVGRQWLEDFTEHAPIYWWQFPLTSLLVALVTMATVILQSWQTANENPVKSIKTE